MEIFLYTQYQGSVLRFSFLYVLGKCLCKRYGGICYISQIELKDLHPALELCKFYMDVALPFNNFMEFIRNSNNNGNNIDTNESISP